MTALVAMQWTGRHRDAPVMAALPPWLLLGGSTTLTGPLFFHGHGQKCSACH